jgi:hypothetical protein
VCTSEKTTAPAHVPLPGNTGKTGSFLTVGSGPARLLLCSAQIPDLSIDRRGPQWFNSGRTPPGGATTSLGAIEALMPLRTISFGCLTVAMTLSAALASPKAQAQATLPGLNNPLTDPGAELRKAEDNRRIREFQAIDGDDDGTLSSEELAADRQARFTALDENGDGSLSRDEFRLRRIDLPAGAAAVIFSGMDATADGRLSRDEYAAAGRADARAADIDGDGSLSIWEFRTRD